MKNQRAIQYLHGLKRYGIKEGLERTQHLLSRLGNPHREYESIHIAGTNGKGSVCRMMEAVLMETDEDIGVFTSPHHYRLGERARVNEEEMRDKEIARFVDTAKPIIEDMTERGDPPTFFEATTAMALWHFNEKDIDTAILEIGMGGRLDTTRVCTSDIAAVTNASLEHTDILGNTVEEIAWEIAQISPENGYLVTAATGNSLNVIEAVAKQRDTQVNAVDQDIEYSAEPLNQHQQRVEISHLDGWEIETNLPLIGEHQARNAAIAAALLNRYGATPNEIQEGLRKAETPLRFETIQTDPRTILDSAHNPAGIRATKKTLEETAKGDIHVVFGALGNKDIPRMIHELSEIAIHAYTSAPRHPKAENPETLAALFEEKETPAKNKSTPINAVQEALRNADTTDTILVTGSTYTAAEARRHWKQRTITKSTNNEKEIQFILDKIGVQNPLTRTRDSTHINLYQWNTTHHEAHKIKTIFTENGCTVNPTNHDESIQYTDIHISGTQNQIQRAIDTLPRHIKHQLNINKAKPPAHPIIMGILNVTPDSFYDGGRHSSTEKAVERAREMHREGADIIDIGGESTRPGAKPVDTDEELSRVIPVVEEISDIDAEISIDTRKPSVAEKALEAGADIINDVTALSHPEMREIAAENSAKVILMHSVSVPVNRDRYPVYDDVVHDVARSLTESALNAERYGVDKEDIILDPGIGFGKKPMEDVELVKRTDELASLGYPVVIGCSRKSFLGELLGEELGDRLNPTVAANIYAAIQGASIFRVHDVEIHRQALDTVCSLLHTEE